MKYLVGFMSEESVKIRSNRIAIAKNCDGITTTHWFNWIKYPDIDEWAMCINDDETKVLTKAEQAVLKTREELENSGWFINENVI